MPAIPSCFFRSLPRVLPLLLCLCLALAGCRGDSSLDGVTAPRLYLEARTAGGTGGAAVDPMRLPVSGTVVAVEREPFVTEFEVVNAELVKVDLGPALLLQLSPEGARKLYRASVTRMGGRIVLAVNGNPVGARRIDGAIADGNFYTFVELPGDELEQLVVDLKDSIARLQTHLARNR
jgi:hypothetical protein